MIITPPYRHRQNDGTCRRMKDETYKRLRHEPESWTVEVHAVEVYMGIGGDHQDEFLLASILNVKYVNSSALHRVEQGLNFVIHQEKYLKVFLTDGNIPIDNSASERAIRTFCIGKKNWMFHNTAKGAGASALVYSI